MCTDGPPWRTEKLTFALVIVPLMCSPCAALGHGHDFLQTCPRCLCETKLLPVTVLVSLAKGECVGKVPFSHADKVVAVERKVTGAWARRLWETEGANRGVVRCGMGEGGHVDGGDDRE